jgi:hypothetical protein
MTPRRATAWWLAALLLLPAAGCLIQPNGSRPRATLVVGVDASGSFRQSGRYDDAMAFLAHYLHGHLNELGGLTRPRELFVGSVGGQEAGEAKAFHPIHDLEGKSSTEIEAALREWFPPTDRMTDFNAFFQQVGRIVKERNLTLSPITVVIATDGLPDTAGRPGDGTPQARFAAIDLSPMEYLSRNVTLRIVYPDPQVSAHWREHVGRRRVRLWTVDGEVMQGWAGQLQADAEPAQQTRLWKWIQDNVDYRVRAQVL